MYKGDLLGYKVVQYGLSNNAGSFYFQMYSSDSGNWTFQFVGTERHIYNRLPSNPINLNGYLHWLCRDDTQALVAYNFYAFEWICRVIPLPERSASNFADTLTISCGSLMYMNTNRGGQLNQQLKIWRLKKYTSGSSKESWELVWDLMLGLCLATEPVAMHPFVEEIIYFVTRQTDYSETHAYLVSGNLHTKNFQLHEYWNQKHRELGDYKSHLFHQFVFPQRLSSIPCPPGCTLVTLPDQH
ncbi:putative F-box protein [Cardamine amara subsp. amara]|uniref:F-box protein n=1 Tax=Cardamine amara subsp. amara TaxID=228776 RepID=A0ABD1APP9_CARAN